MAAFALLLLVAPGARADLLTPVLISTNPLSPGASTMPVVKGVISNPDTQVITLGASPLGPITQAEDPTNVVRLYKDPLCEGTQVAQGTVATLSEGIQVTVPPNSVTTFYATQEDAGGPSGCSNGLRYRQVSTPPSVPVFTSIDPASPANNNFPRLIGSADPEATVSIYAGAGCGGAAVASGSGEQFGGEGILVGVADNTETIFSARVTLAGFFTECSGPVEYREITPPAPAGPEPRWQQWRRRGRGSGRNPARAPFADGPGRLGERQHSFGHGERAGRRRGQDLQHRRLSGPARREGLRRRFRRRPPGARDGQRHGRPLGALQRRRQGLEVLGPGGLRRGLARPRGPGSRWAPRRRRRSARR